MLVTMGQPIRIKERITKNMTQFQPRINLGMTTLKSEE
jgi:hypothetical protein